MALNILLQEDLTIRGGAQLWLLNCGGQLKNAGHNITFLLPEDSLIRLDAEALEGATVVTYEHARSAEDPESYRELFTSLLTPAQVCVTLVRQKRGNFQNVEFVASCIAQAGLKTYLIAKTGTPDESYKASFYGGDLLGREPPQSSVITIAEYTRQFIIEKMGVDGKYIQNIYNGTDTTRFRRTPEMAEESLKRYPCKEGAYVVGCVGSYEPRKGQTVLLQAAKKLLDEGKIPNIHLLFVGEGPDKDMLLGKIDELGLTEHVSLCDFTREPFYVFERCDMIALPSFKEGLPNVLLEAIAMETPCVASRIMGCPEVVRDGETGYCFEAGDVDGCADAIFKLFSLDPEERERFAANGKKMVLDEHDKHKNFERLLTFIQEKAATAL